MLERQKGFTLIELLIVVAIIAILAAIAVPNFLEAQTRSKVSRCQADMRTLATGVESYSVDWNKPLLGGWLLNEITGGPFPNELDVLVPLSTPIAYITNPLIKDPFALKSGTIIPGSVQTDEFGTYRYDSAVPIDALPDAGQTWSHHRAAEKNYTWWLYSYGPSGDAVASTGNWRIYAEHILADWYEFEVYDPTNGTVSKGLVMRTNKGVYTGQDYEGP